MRNVYLLGAMLALAALLALAIDAPVARFCIAGRVAKWVEEPLMIAEAFAHLFGVALIVLAVWVLDVAGRRAVLRLSACVFGAGLLADVVKMMVHRTRPKQFDYAANIWESFGGWFAWQDDFGELFHRNIQSFPSGHSTIAAGLAVGLAFCYPRGRWLFAVLAILACSQRIVAAAHFVSDVFAGAALGCLFAAICIDSRGLGKFFDKFERRSLERGKRAVK